MQEFSHAINTDYTANTAEVHINYQLNIKCIQNSINIVFN
jgi:hypothetical protein